MEIDTSPRVSCVFFDDFTSRFDVGADVVGTFFARIRLATFFHAQYGVPLVSALRYITALRTFLPKRAGIECKDGTIPISPTRHGRVSRSVISGKVCTSRNTSQHYTTPLPVLQQFNRARKKSVLRNLMEMDPGGAATEKVEYMASIMQPFVDANSTQPQGFAVAKKRSSAHHFGVPPRPLPYIRPLDLGTVPLATVAKAAKRLVKFPRKAAHPAGIDVISYTDVSSRTAQTLKVLTKERPKKAKKMPKYYEAKTWNVAACRKKGVRKRWDGSLSAAWEEGGGDVGGVPFLRQGVRVPLEEGEACLRHNITGAALSDAESIFRSFLSEIEPLPRQILADAELICRQIAARRGPKPIPRNDSFDSVF